MELQPDTQHVRDILTARRGTLYLHRRIAKLNGRNEQLDHLSCSTAGALLIQERELPGAVTFANGTMLAGHQDQRGVLDSVRRQSEALEYEISRPVDPVLVITTGAPFETTQVRAVQVVHVSAFTAFLDGLPDTVDRAEMVLMNARLEKFTRPDVSDRRIPDWEVNGVISTFNGRPDPGTPTQGPRDFRQLRRPGNRPSNQAPTPPRRHLQLPRASERASGAMVVIAIIVAAILLASFLLQ